MQLTLPQLCYPNNALEPFISRTTIELHHGNIRVITQPGRGTTFVRDVVSATAERGR